MLNAREQTKRILAAALLLALACGLAPPGVAQGDAFPGDVNRDGVINVLDVQSSINMALGDSAASAEADVDEDGSVFVTDIQVITNTALGVSGLVQPVIGTLDFEKVNPEDGPYLVVAVSEDGRVQRTRVNPQSGDFRLTLPVRTAWSFGFVAAPDTAPETIGTLRFPLREGASTLLPLLRLSRGVPMDLGNVQPQLLAEPTDDIRELLGEIAEPLDDSDFDEDGLADILEELLLPLPLDLSILGISNPNLESLVALINDEFEDLVIEGLAECLEDELELFLEGPDLTGIEDNGLPLFLDPLFFCLYESVEEELLEELEDEGEDLANLVEFVPLYIDFISQWLLIQLDTWLFELNDPELIDENDNGIPDYIEEDICLSGDDIPGVPFVLGECEIDEDTNGIPDFAEDADGDERPNYFDLDARTPDDLDADGVRNSVDTDDDDDGIPDYADAEPANARLQ